jgi:hypothetical protein
VSDWQPIATAPLHVPLIVWAKLYGKASAFVAKCEGDYGRWEVQGVGGYEWETDIDTPTHWMPIPDPPTSP